MGRDSNVQLVLGVAKLSIAPGVARSGAARDSRPCEDPGSAGITDVRRSCSYIGPARVHPFDVVVYLVYFSLYSDFRYTGYRMLII